MFTIDEIALMGGIAIMALWLKYFLRKNDHLNNQITEFKEND